MKTLMRLMMLKRASGPPAAPTALSAANNADPRVAVLTFTDPAGTITARQERHSSDGGSTWSTPASISASPASVSVASVYYANIFQVRATTAGGTSDWSTSSAAVTSTGFAGYWKLDETASPAADSSGNGNSGTWAGGTVSGSTDVPVPPINFTDTHSISLNNEYVDVGSNASLNISGVGTIAGWIKPTAGCLASNHFVFSTNGNDGAEIQFGLEVGRHANKLDAIWGGGGGYDILYSTADLTADTWQHVALTRAGTSGAWTVKLYINGTLDSTQSGTAAAGNFVGGDIGSIRDSGAGAWVGLIDDVRMYNCVLTDAEIASLASGNIQ